LALWRLNPCLREKALTPPAAWEIHWRRANPHYDAKVKRVIYLHMSGAPPHLDIFDYKPLLVKHNGEPAPDSFVKGKRFAFTTGTPNLMGTPS